MNDTTPPCWQTCSDVPLLEQQAIQVWQLDLKTYPCDPDCLNRQEVQRLAKFQNRQAKTRFYATRSALRYLLGDYLQLAPVDVPLCIDQQGKPYVTDHAIHFNLSHSDDTALFAFSYCTAVGVDIEKPRTLGDIPALAKQVFDAETLHQLAKQHYTAEAFMRYWVRLEARQKYAGLGIFAPPVAHTAVDLYDATLADNSHFCVAWCCMEQTPKLQFFTLDG